MFFNSSSRHQLYSIYAWIFSQSVRFKFNGAKKKKGKYIYSEMKSLEDREEFAEKEMEIKNHKSC